MRRIASPISGAMGRMRMRAESFAASVRPGGRVLLSGLLVEQAADVVAAYGRHGLVLEHRVDFETGGDQWRSLILRKC